MKPASPDPQAADKLPEAAKVFQRFFSRLSALPTKKVFEQQGKLQLFLSQRVLTCLTPQTAKHRGVGGLPHRVFVLQSLAGSKGCKLLPAGEGLLHCGIALLFRVLLGWFGMVFGCLWWFLDVAGIVFGCFCWFWRWVAVIRWRWWIRAPLQAMLLVSLWQPETPMCRQGTVWILSSVVLCNWCKVYLFFDCFLVFSKSWLNNFAARFNKMTSWNQECSVA